MSVTRVRSFRANEAQWEKWLMAAESQGLNLNAWARRSLDHAAVLQEALKRMETKETK